MATVISYIKLMNALVNPTQTLYIGVDGVAPMAKIKQQRMRRFKSALQAEEESRLRAEARGHKYEEIPRWDTNAITPGTQFMEKLTLALREYASTNKRIVVSPADEPGEGEQKIMAWVRKHKPSDVVVYGLDADLIVLSLWAHAIQGTQMDLFREETEFNGSIKEDTLGETQFLYLNIQHLSSALYTNYGVESQSKASFLTDFVGLMNLLGNDFVPHGMALKIKDEGVEKLLTIYKNHVVPNGSLVTNSAGVWSYSVPALITIFKELVQSEPHWMLKNIRKKLEARVGFTSSKDPEDQALARYNDSPVNWAVERCIVSHVQKPDEEKPRMQLKPNWRDIYDKEALLAPHSSQVYLESLSWTLAYYSGESVDMEWYYPWFLPPRMESIVNMLESYTSLPVPTKERPLLKPLEQLAMVLPQSSFTLLPASYRAMIHKYPHAWPESYTTYSFGRRFLWECEPLIPLIQAPQIRSWISAL